MKLSDAKAYIESATIRVNIGSFFFNGKPDDYNSDEEYDTAVKLSDPSQYVEFRQPTVDEMKKAKTQADLPNGIDMSNPGIVKLVLDRADENSGNNETFEFLLTLMKKCLVDSSFTDDTGEGKADSKDVMDVIRSNTIIFKKVLEGFTSTMGK
jgi:hypothetical protein